MRIVLSLFSHEKKKEYWDQLESRCRYLHRRLGANGAPLPHSSSSSSGGVIVGGVGGGHYLLPHSHLTLPVSISAANLLQSNPTTHCECCSAAAATGMVHDSTFEER
jgi:hypothetical protein